LDYATKVLNPRYGAVRNIMTPEGRHRVRGFDDLQPEGRYVACGREPYKRLNKPYVFLSLFYNFLSLEILSCLSDRKERPYFSYICQHLLHSYGACWFSQEILQTTTMNHKSKIAHLPLSAGKNPRQQVCSHLTNGCVRHTCKCYLLTYIHVNMFITVHIIG